MSLWKSSACAMSKAEVVQMIFPEDLNREQSIDERNPEQPAVSFAWVNWEFLLSRMERSGAAEKACWKAKWLRKLVGGWGFEPQTPTVSSSALPLINSFQINTH
jgi:hypothetical protein